MPAADAAGSRRRAWPGFLAAPSAEAALDRQPPPTLALPHKGGGDI